MNERHKNPNPTGDSGQSVSAGSQSGQHESTFRVTYDASGNRRVTLSLEILEILNSFGLTTSDIGTLPAVQGEIGQMSVSVRDWQSGREVKPPLVWNTSPGKYVFKYTLENIGQVPQLLDLFKQIREPGDTFAGVRLKADDSSSLLRLYKLEDLPGASEMTDNLPEPSPATPEVNQQRSGERQIAEPRSRGSDQENVAPPSKRQTRNRCVGCGSDNHHLGNCLKAGDDGLMKGCPHCNTLSHNASNCQAVRTDDERFNWFVRKRGCMPSFLDFNTWFPLMSFQRSAKVQNRLPWTAEFTKFNADDIDRIQNAFDNPGPGKEYELPKDPRLWDWEAVEMYHQRRAKKDQKALDPAKETVIHDGIVMNKKRAEMILAGDS
ncbi:hypothetical protein FPANT_10996 [Fusarium pseudoanthophilum]|uniref:Uncharacterized protein n=1 Tax=Fusarium pseudoanthophilum TaxID=48495 RepID=A0A8H5KNE5_9HYPO|nr:hypothetical protein FPANT_10996 [Fusarium pseudoanthophilum]